VDNKTVPIPFRCFWARPNCVVIAAADSVVAMVIFATVKALSSAEGMFPTSKASALACTMMNARVTRLPATAFSEEPL